MTTATIKMQWNKSEFAPLRKLVQDYAENIVLKATINAQFKVKIDALEETLKAYHLQEDTLGKSEKLDAMIAGAEETIDKLKAECKAELKRQLAYVEPEAVTRLKKAVNKLEKDCDKTQVEGLIIGFFETYGAHVKDTADLARILDAIGKSGNAGSLMAKSAGAYMQAYQGGNTVKAMIKELYAIMVAGGFIKATSIPTVLRDRYVKTKKNKKAKKNQ